MVTLIWVVAQIVCMNKLFEYLFFCFQELTIYMRLYWVDKLPACKHLIK